MRGRPKGGGTGKWSSNNPYRRIAAAVLSNAVTMAGRRHAPVEAARIDDTPEEAREWLAGPKATRWICLMGYDPQAFREAVARKGVR